MTDIASVLMLHDFLALYDSFGRRSVTAEGKLGEWEKEIAYWMKKATTARDKVFIEKDWATVAKDRGAAVEAQRAIAEVKASEFETYT
ncbi:hypothetical protein Nepgr_023215 [Nepenthes gracilis]|uniref:Uncharacterized protein n=1 Tax=Nepenthes gracilis TaxID=150966 RepID=A0AAD3XXP5_NEPGR|nr:hypothetical protein Nepgr_023215 [Nepenthes gracilis]